MEGNNLRPAAPVGGGDWRATLKADLRPKNVEKIMEALKRNLHVSVPEGLIELRRIAEILEEKIYAAATSQSDYSDEISLKILPMEGKSPVSLSSSLLPNSTGTSNKPTDPGASPSMQPQVHNQGLSLPTLLPTNQPQAHQQMVSQNSLSTITSTGVQAFSSLLPTSLPSVSASLDSTTQTSQANGDDWQEEVYQKIKTMKEMYLPELNEMHQKIAAKLQQHDSLTQQPKTDQIEKLKMFKTMLERMISFLQVSKNNVLISFKEKLNSYERQIIIFLNTNPLRKPMPAMQQGQPPTSHMQSLQQPSSHITLAQPHENQMNPQLQSVALQSSASGMQQNNNMSSMQHSLSGVATPQQNMMNSLQTGSNLDSGQGNAMASPQQGPMGSLQQHPSSSQPASLSSVSSQRGLTMLQPSLPLQSNSSNMLQHQHLKQQQQPHDQQIMQSQQYKQQYHQLQMQQQLMQQQLMLQQRLFGTMSGNSSMQNFLSGNSSTSMQQLPSSQTQLPTQQTPQLHQMDVNYEVKPDISSLPNATGSVAPNIGQAPPEPLAIGTSGVSVPDGAQVNAGADYHARLSSIFFRFQGELTQLISEARSSPAATSNKG